MKIMLSWEISKAFSVGEGALSSLYFKIHFEKHKKLIFWYSSIHCVKNVRIRKFLVCIFPFFGWIRRFTLNSVNLLISDYSKRNILEHSRTSIIERFCENSQQLLVVHYLSKDASSQMFDWVLNTPLTLKFRVLRTLLISNFSLNMGIQTGKKL